MRERLLVALLDAETLAAWALLATAELEFAVGGDGVTSRSGQQRNGPVVDRHRGADDPIAAQAQAHDLVGFRIVK